MRRSILAIAPYYDRTVPGESWCTYMWLKGISERHDLTVLTTHNRDWKPQNSPLPNAEIINWLHHPLKAPLQKLDRELKPHYIQFYWRATQWIRENIANRHFQLIHQINPVAPRYPSPAQHSSLPYILGPHAGAVPTPRGFLQEMRHDAWYRHLRTLDQMRITFDPLLRRSFSRSSLILGVAPYMETLLRPVSPRRFEIMVETGPEELINQQSAILPRKTGQLKLLFVGRLTRTKGVIDAIRAIAELPFNSQITLDILGEGELRNQCEQLIARNSLQNKVFLHGRVPREVVNQYYRSSDIFLFPSFREASGTVVFEALGAGIPVITASTGGPGYAVTPDCGICVDPINPKQYSTDLAQAIMRLIQNPDRLSEMSAAAVKRVNCIASWDRRYDRLSDLYSSILDSPTYK